MTPSAATPGFGVRPDDEPPGRRTLFEQALGLLGLNEPRMATRHPCRIRASCRTVTLSVTVEQFAEIHDLSRTGLSLWTNQRLTPGRYLAVRCPALLGASLRVSVLHVEPLGHGWQVGGCFCRPLEERELECLLGASTLEA